MTTVTKNTHWEQWLSTLGAHDNHPGHHKCPGPAEEILSQLVLGESLDGFGISILKRLQGHDLVCTQS